MNTKTFVVIYGTSNSIKVATFSDFSDAVEFQNTHKMNGRTPNIYNESERV